MSATDEATKEIRREFGAWLLTEIAAHGFDRPTFIERVGYGKGTVSRWINGEASPSPPAIVKIGLVLRIPPNVLLYRIAGIKGAAEAIDFATLNLPPSLTQGESRLVEHLAWAVRHWRVERNAASGNLDADIA